MTKYVLGFTVAALAAVATPAIADEAKAPVSASMFLSIMNRPAEARDVAYDRALKEETGPAARPPLTEILPDGSVKMDKVIVTVRNPCPPGTHFEEPRLPGRRARN